jgi:hypothetical protein
MASEHDELPDDRPQAKPQVAPPKPVEKPAPKPTPKDLVSEYDFGPEETELDEFDLPPTKATEAKPETPRGSGGQEKSGESAPTPAAPRHSPIVLQLAEEYGLEGDDLNVPPEQLERTVRLIHRRELARQKSIADYASRDQAASPGADSHPPAGPAPAGGQSLPAQRVEKEDDLLAPLAKYNDLVHEDVIGLFRDVVAPLVKKVRDLEGGVSTLAKIETGRREVSIREQIDQGFGSLGEAFQGVFGQGAYDDMDKESMEFQRRHFVVQSLQQKPGTGPLKAQIARRARELFGAGVPATTAGAPQSAEENPPRPAASRPKDPATGRFLSDEEAEAKAKEEAWVRGGLQRPTHREPTDLPKGPKRAKIAVAGYLKQHGLNGDADDSDERDELPG